MTDPNTFETRLAEAFGRYADRMPVDVDAAAVVGWAAVDRARARRWSGTWLGPQLVPVVVGLLALAALAGAIVAGSLVLRSEPISIAPPSIAPSGLTPVAPSGPIRVAETGAMLTPRTGHTAVRLRDGRVLIVGGASTSGEALASAELWDPATSRFSAAGRMTTTREYTTATLLDDGRVLIAGGVTSDPASSGISLASAELFDPATGTFSATDPMPYGRGICNCLPTSSGTSHPLATRLLDGRVFVAGGRLQGTGYRQATDPNNPPGNHADIFDPRSARFTRSPTIPCDTTRSTVTTLIDGRVLIVCISSAVIWDPTSDRFAATGTPRMTYPGDATRLPDGRVLLTAPIQTGTAPPAEVYDPATGTFQLLAEVANPGRMRFVLPDGRILLAADSFFATDGATQVFDPTTGATTALEPPVPVRRGEATATVLDDGRILIAGGDDWNGRAMPSLLVDPTGRP